MLTFQTYPIAKSMLIDLYSQSITLTRSCENLYLNEKFFYDIDGLIALKLNLKHEVDYQIAALKIEIADYEKHNIC